MARQRFEHALTQEVAYGVIPPADRRELHRRVVAEMERLYVERIADHVERLGDHAFEGELWDKAVVYLRRAGVNAALRSAGREAAARFERAKQALDHLPPTRSNQERAMQLRLTLRNPLFLLADFGHALEVLGEVVTLADALGAPAQAGLACAYMANAHFMLGNLDAGMHLAEQARSNGAARGDAALLAITCCHLGQLLYAKGDYAASVAMMEKCLEHLEGAPSRRGSNMARVYSVVARCFNAFSLAAQGRFREAEASAERCLGLADATDTPFLRALAAWAMGNAQLGRGPAAEAAGKLEEAYRYCENAELLAIRPWIDRPRPRPSARRPCGGSARSPRRRHRRGGRAWSPVPALPPLRVSERGPARGGPRGRSGGVGHAGGGPGRRACRGRGVAWTLCARSPGWRGSGARRISRRPRSISVTPSPSPRIYGCGRPWPTVAGDLAEGSRRAGQSEEAARHLEAARELYRDLDLPYGRERLSGEGWR